MKYCVCNDKGELIGHDMGERAAEDLCAMMRAEELDAGWTVLEQEVE